MWHLRPVAAAPGPRSQQQKQPQPLAPPGEAGAPAAAALRAAWSVTAPIPQRLICAGVSAYAPSATAAGQAAFLSSAAVNNSGSSRSPGRERGDGERYASVWWPQHREQRQRHYAAGMPSVGQEKLRHPGPVTGACAVQLLSLPACLAMHVWTMPAAPLHVFPLRCGPALQACNGPLGCCNETSFAPRQLAAAAAPLVAAPAPAAPRRRGLSLARRPPQQLWQPRRQKTTLH